MCIRDRLIDAATPEKPRYTPPSQKERETARAVTQVEADIPLTEHLLWRRNAGYSIKWLAVPGLLILVLLFIAALGFALSRRDGQSVAPAVPAAPVAEAPAAGAPANPAAAVPAPANPAPADPEPTESSEEPPPTPESTTTTDCVLPASTIQVAIANDSQERSTFMPSLMMQVWDVNFTNDTPEAVVVGVHYTSTRGGKIITEEWIKRRVSPGRTEHESGSRDLTVNGKKAEQASLIIDRLVVVENRDACMPLLDDPQVQAQAVDLPVPPTP